MDDAATALAAAAADDGHDGHDEDEDSGGEDEDSDAEDEDEDEDSGGEDEDEDDDEDSDDGGGEGEGREGAGWVETYLNPPVTSHPYLEDKYPGIRLPLALRDFVVLERAQEILMGVHGEEPLRDERTRRIHTFSCDGRRLNDDIATMDQMYSLAVHGPCRTLPSTIVPSFMPELERLQLHHVVPSSTEQDGGRRGENFSVAKDIVEQLNITNLEIRGSAANIIRQFYPLGKVTEVSVGDPHPNDDSHLYSHRATSNRSLVELIETLQQDNMADDGDKGSKDVGNDGTTTKLVTTPFSRSIEILSVSADPLTVDQFCDFILLLRPDKFPNLNEVSILGTVTVSVAHIEMLVRRLTKLMDDKDEDNKNILYHPPRLTNLYLDDQSRCFDTIAGLKSILSLLNILDTIVDIGYSPVAPNRRREESERDHPEYKKLLRQLMFTLNYINARFTVAAPIATRSAANKSKCSQQHNGTQGNDPQSYGHTTTANNFPLALWPKVFRRACVFWPKYEPTGKTMDRLLIAPGLRRSTDEREKDLLQCRASTIFVLLRNGLAGNMDWQDEYRRHGRKEEPATASIENPTPNGSANSTNRKRRRSHEEAKGEKLFIVSNDYY